MTTIDWTRRFCLAAACGVLVFVILTASIAARRDGTEIEIENSILSDGPMCASSGCHDLPSGSFLNMGGDAVINSLPAAYQAGMIYQMELEITGTASSRVYGFQMAALNPDGTQAGILLPRIPGVARPTLGDVEFLTHSPEPLESGTIPFLWRADDDPQGDVTFRVAANAGNDDSDPGGDFINLRQFTVPLMGLEPPQQEGYFPQIGDGQVSNIRFQTSVIFVNAGQDTEIELSFFNSQGEPISVQLGALGTQQTFQIPLGGGESFSAQTSGAQALQVGYARFRSGEGVGGTAIFTRSEVDSGVTLFETGVPASPLLEDFSLFVDQEGNRRTGLAMVNPGSSTATVTLRLFDLNFAEQATVTRFIEPGAHLPQFVDELFSLPEGFKQGMMTVESTEPLSALTLRETDDPSLEFPEDVPALAAFPVIPGRAQ